MEKFWEIFFRAIVLAANFILHQRVFHFFCGLVCRRSATPHLSIKFCSSIWQSSVFLRSPNSEFWKFRHCLCAGFFYYLVMSLCHHPTSVNLALFGRVINQVWFRHGLYIAFPLWKDPFQCLYFSFRHRFGIRFRSRSGTDLFFFGICFKSASHSMYPFAEIVKLEINCSALPSSIITVLQGLRSRRSSALPAPDRYKYSGPISLSPPGVELGSAQHFTRTGMEK